MNKFVVLYLLSLCISAVALASDSEAETLKLAYDLYGKGLKAEAKTLFLKTANNGSADAHYYLGYAYAVAHDERVYRYEQAALKGHEKALKGYLEATFFRLASIEQVNPVKALHVYHSAKKANPELSFYNENSQIKVLKYAAELPHRDVDNFYHQYHLEQGEHSYHIWELAELASGRSEVFGEPDPELIFWLITRGGDVPAEKSQAITDYYHHWKNGKVVKFEICDYITSGHGMRYCSRRAAKVADRKRAEALTRFKQSLPADIHDLLLKAYEEMEIFITLKANSEELHGGSGRAAWISGSIQAQKDGYLTFLKKVKNGFSEKTELSGDIINQQLNRTYKRVMEKLKTDSFYSGVPDAQSLNEVQDQWFRYREANLLLLTALTDGDTHWKDWLTNERIKQIQQFEKQLNAFIME